MQFSIVDAANPSASPEEIEKKFKSYIGAEDEDDDLSRVSTNLDENEAEEDLEDYDEDIEPVSEVELKAKAVPVVDKKEKKKRLAVLRRRSIAARAYDFLGKDSDVSGIIFMEVLKITDLPPERNSKCWARRSFVRSNTSLSDAHLL